MANSKIYLGNTNIGSLFKGASDISIYLGENKVYPLAEPSFKWKAAYQDSHTESAECDSSSEIAYLEIKGTGLTSVEIGDCVTSIGGRAFYQYSGLTSVTIPNSVTNIAGDAFKYCSSLTSIDIPSGVTSIGADAFEGCSGLTSIDIPSGVTSISDRTFYGCNSLTSCTIPNSVTTIGSGAFQDCKSLTSIVIPSGVTSIGYQAFVQCVNLTSITCLATTPPTLNYRVFNTGNNCPIYVPSASVNAYKTATVWSGYASRIQAIP